MVDAIIRFSIRNKALIGLFMIGWVVLGIWSMTRVPIDAVPDITNNQVQIITQAPNLGAEEIEQYVTYPIELAMGNLPGLVEIRSISRFGLSVVTVVFEDDMGTYLPRQLVAEKLNDVREEIPEEFGQPYMGPISTGLGEIFQYTLKVDSAYRDRYSLQDLRTIQDWIISRQMVMLPGVIEVNSIGGKIKQYEVEVDPEQLNALGLTVTDVFEALERNNQNTGGAYIEKSHQAHFIRGEGLVGSIEDIENIVVKTIDGTPIFIKDVARVRYGAQVRYGAITENGQGEVVGGIVMMLKGENSNDVVKRVKERLAEIEKTLPEGVHIEPVLDRSRLIKNTTSTIISNLVEGAAIVIFILILLLGDWRAGLIVASTIPLSLLFAFMLMKQFGIWANLMSLGAIDFGIIVDGAVIIVESAVFLFYRQLAKGKQITAAERDRVSHQAATRMMNAAFFGQLIILIVFIPVLALEGVEGKMFKPMAYTFMFAMVGVMILCLTYVPMMTAWFLRPRPKTKPSVGDRIVRWLEDRYEPLVQWALRRGGLVLGAAVGMLAVAVWVFIRMGGEFMPRLDEGDLAYNLIMKPGTSLSETIKATTEAERLLLENFPEVVKVNSRIGVSEIPNDPMPFDFADVVVILRPKDEWTSAETKDELVEKMKAVLSTLPGVAFSFSQPIENRFNELLEGVREDIAIKIYGEDIHVLAEKAQEAARIIAGTPGIGDIRVEATTGLPQIVIRYNRQKMARYGLSVEELNRLVATAFGGGVAGTVFEGEKRFALVVRLRPEYRQDIEHVRSLWVPLPDGARIPLKEVADIRYEPGPMQISRDNTHRRVYVGINVRGRDIESLVEEIRQKLEDQLELPPGYYIQYGGAFENLQRAVERLKILLPLALGLIFGLIFLALRSFGHTVMIYVAIPLAAIGGVFSLWARGMPFSVSAGIGFIVLFGVAVLNGLVLINGWNHLKKSGSLPLDKLIIQGARRRVRPILLTALTDILGFLPMAISTSAGAEVQRPLATVVIGGLFTSTLLTLFVLPILYRWLESVRGSGLGARRLGTALFWVAVVGAPMGAFTQPAQPADIPVIRSVEALLDSAQRSNLTLQRLPHHLEAAHWHVRRSIAFPKADVSVEYGQYSSYENDLAVRLSQTLDFPSLYAARRRWARARYGQMEAQAEAMRRQVDYELRQTWEQLAYWRAIEKVLARQDSLLERLVASLNRQYAVGAIGRLEMLAAENQRSELRHRRVAAQAEAQRVEAELRRLLGGRTDIRFVPPAVAMLPVPDTAGAVSAALGHPLVRAAQEAHAVARRRMQIERRRALPGFTVGVFDMSLKGVELPSGRPAGPTDRFRGVEAGLSLPLLPGGYRAAARMARAEAQMAAIEAQQAQASIQSRVRTLVEMLRTHQAALHYYHTEALPNSQRLIQMAQESFQQGKIDLFRTLTYYDRALQIQQDYLDMLHRYNQAVIEFDYLTQP